MTVRYPGFDTLALHAGQPPDPATGKGSAHLCQDFVRLRGLGPRRGALQHGTRRHVYSRISNPTVAVFEERMAALEQGVGAIATASGQAALHLAIVTLMGAGRHIVASRSLYGGSHNLLAYTLARFGIETTFVGPRDLARGASAIRPHTPLLFGETLGNPGLDVLDLPAVSALAHRAWHAAAGRLDLHDTVADDAVRPRRRPRLPLGDEIPRRPRRGDRRRADRWRHVRLAGQRPLPT